MPQGGGDKSKGKSVREKKKERLFKGRMEKDQLGDLRGMPRRGIEVFNIHKHAEPSIIVTLKTTDG